MSDDVSRKIEELRADLQDQARVAQDITDPAERSAALQRIEAIGREMNTVEQAHEDEQRYAEAAALKAIIRRGLGYDS